MSFIDVVPGSFSASLVGGYDQRFTSPILKDSAGAAVTMTGWDTLTCVLTALVPGPMTKAPTNIGTVTGLSSGAVQLDVDDTDASGLIAGGQCRMQIIGKKTSGDDNQLLTSGTLTYTPSV